MPDRYAVVIVDHDGNAQTHAKYIDGGNNQVISAADAADNTARFINTHGNYKAFVVGY